MFGLPPGEPTGKYAPAFRTLIPYFIRRGKDAYVTPFEHFRKQHEWDKQVNNAFLLGLNWEDAKRWQSLKDKKGALNDLKKAQDAGLVEEVAQGSLGELEASKIRLEEVVREHEAGLASFKVHPQYSDLEKRANALSRRIVAAVNKNVTCRQLLSSYQEALADAPEAKTDEVVAIYEEAGIFFAESGRRRLEEVKEFHRQLIENRRRFLEAEIDRLEASIAAGEAEQRRLDEERASVLTILQDHGALEQHTRLQQELVDKKAHLRSIQAQIDALRRLEDGKSRLRIEEEVLRRKTRNDLDDRREQRARAISIFNENAEALYDSPANLLIDVGPSGFKFDIEIIRSKSHGVGNMKILCYDLMLAELWSQRAPSPRLLIHDSLLFDGVDERQVAHALELAAAKARACDFQYVCMINSDAVPREDFSPDFDFESYVRRVLTDTDPSGSLLGFRYLVGEEFLHLCCLP